MFLAILQRAAIIALFCINLSGCGYFQRPGAEDDVDMTEIDDIEKIDPTKRERTDTRVESPVVVGELELKLKVGDRFPLSKTIEHRLTQMGQDGSQISSSKTDLIFSLVIDDMLPNGRKQMTVRYSRVRYEQEIRGKRIVYSSEKNSEPVPAEALLYAGLANNGFSFWIGPDNKVTNVIDFGEFLTRCLRNVPEQHKAAIRQQLESTKREDGVANFIDDSIGLLPYSNDPNHPAIAVKEGSSWDLELKHTEAPIPMDISTRCILKELSKSSAEILLTGTISGSRNPVIMRNTDGIKVLVLGGYSTGTCRVDRQTGLPTHSQIQRHLELAMELPDGQKIQQNKDTLSTITAYLDQSQKPAENSTSSVQQTSFQNALGTENHRRVVPAVDARQN